MAKQITLKRAPEEGEKPLRSQGGGRKMNEVRQQAEETYEVLKEGKSEDRARFARRYFMECIYAYKGNEGAKELVKLFEEHNPELRKPSWGEIREYERMLEVLRDRYSNGNYEGARRSEEYVNELALALYGKETPEEKQKRLKETRAILKANSPELSDRIDAAYEQLERAQSNRARISREIYSQCEIFANSTGHYMTRGQRARELHNATLQEDPNARWAEQDHMSALARYGAVNQILYDAAEKLTLEEAKATNLDEKLKTE